ncbi:MAG: tRNA (adenosine(37)-N6)-threonylcarbamoyltransferase complex dimerization subunit type 1 TsaB [Gammaproteobacteria bacterium]
MKLLAIDTSSSACSVAIMIDDKVKALHEIAPMQQAQKILPMIDSLLRDTNTSLNQLDALAFGCGPGSFTGVRIATSVMQGLGYAMNLPLIPVSSLAALAQATYEDLGWKNLLVGVDARIQEVYWGAYQANSRGWVELVGKEQVCPPEAVIVPKEMDWNGVGNAWEVYNNQLPYKPSTIDTSRLPMATGILSLAKIHFKNQQWVKPADAVPVYLRDDVAKKSN